MIGRWKRQAVCTGTLLAAGLLGAGCMKKEETSGGTLADRRAAQLQAQPFASYGDGRLPQEMKLLPPQQGTGGGGAPAPQAPAGGAAQPQGAGAAAPGTPAAAPGTPAAAPGQGTPTQQQERPRSDSGSSPEKG
ncbi:MAG TPA: hypothetical protein VFO83_13110 [Aggregicoccus sp.]|nr:hypothetical protein [Aggregicoccus sp.]